MAWIESNQELGRHPKSKRAARILNISVPAIIGHLHFLWWWCLEYAQDGDLSDYDVQDIADAANWEGDPEEFVQALLDCGPGDSLGFLERDEYGHLHVHDWMDYAGRLIEKRQANAKRMKNARKKNVQQTCDERAGATVPNRTVPNRTVPYNNNNNAREDDTKSSKLESDETTADGIQCAVTDSGKTVSELAQTVPSLDDIVLETDGMLPVPVGTQAVIWAENNWGRMVSPKEANDIIAWCDEFSTRGSPDSDALVIEGLKQCNDAGVRNMNYLRSVLTDWRENGVLTVDHVLARESERKNKKRDKRNSSSGDISHPPKVQPDKYKNFYL